VQKPIGQQSTLLVRIRPNAYKLARKLSKREAVPMSILLSDLVTDYWNQGHPEDQPSFQNRVAN